MRCLAEFIRSEDGAITIEWVALAAGVILLALGVIVIIEAGLTNSTNSIATAVQSVVVSLANLT